AHYVPRHVAPLTAMRSAESPTMRSAESLNRCPTWSVHRLALRESCGTRPPASAPAGAPPSWPPSALGGEPRSPTAARLLDPPPFSRCGVPSRLTRKRVGTRVHVSARAGHRPLHPLERDAR